METKIVEYELAMSSYRKEQNEIVSVLESMFGKYGEPKKAAKGIQEGAGKETEGYFGKPDDYRGQIGYPLCGGLADIDS